MSEQQFLNLIERNKRTLFRISSIYAVKGEAMDLFQEILLNIWRSIPTFDNRSSIDTWAYRIAINVCLRSKAKTDKRKNFIFSSEGLKLDNVSADPSANKEHKELYNCIHKLNDIDKSIVLLHLEEMSHKEISEITGLTENNIAVKLLRIRSKLLTCLNETK